MSKSWVVTLLTATLYVPAESDAITTIMPRMAHSWYAIAHQAYFGYGDRMSAMTEEIKAISHASWFLVWSAREQTNASKGSHSQWRLKWSQVRTDRR